MRENGVTMEGTVSVSTGASGGIAGVSGRKSIYESSYIEALSYKWIASERAGRDLGDDAISEWLRLYWGGWCRERWLEHLMGEVFWAEFGGAGFAALKGEFEGDEALEEQVLEKIRTGWENLDIILWATERKIDTSKVIDILILADINRPELDKSFFAVQCAT